MAACEGNRSGNYAHARARNSGLNSSGRACWSLWSSRARGSNGPDCTRGSSRASCACWSGCPGRASRSCRSSWAGQAGCGQGDVRAAIKRDLHGSSCAAQNRLSRGRRDAWPGSARGKGNGAAVLCESPSAEQKNSQHKAFHGMPFLMRVDVPRNRDFPGGAQRI